MTGILGDEVRTAGQPIGGATRRVVFVDSSVLSAQVLRPVTSLQDTACSSSGIDTAEFDHPDPWIVMPCLIAVDLVPGLCEHLTCHIDVS